MPADADSKRDVDDGRGGSCVGDLMCRQKYGNHHVRERQQLRYPKNQSLGYEVHWGVILMILTHHPVIHRHLFQALRGLEIK